MPAQGRHLHLRLAVVGAAAARRRTRRANLQQHPLGSLDAADFWRRRRARQECRGVEARDPHLQTERFQRGRLDLRRCLFRQRHGLPLRQQREAEAGLDAAGPALALPQRGLRTKSLCETRCHRARVQAEAPLSGSVNDDRHVRHGDRGLGDIRRDDDLPRSALRRHLEASALLIGRQPTMQRQRQQPATTTFGSVLQLGDQARDLADARNEHEDSTVSWAILQLPLHGREDELGQHAEIQRSQIAWHRGLLLRLALPSIGHLDLAVVTVHALLLVVHAKQILGIFQIQLGDREGSAGHLHHGWPYLEHTRKLLDVHRRAHEQHPQLRSLGQLVAQQCQ
mmetsp:Transcript_7345/g.26770  ORF Transcript_7345/g.26770 Transcript_7345/m.26770 type:complete len:339 (-) Transcript_7345:2328-3344(-)